MFPLVQRWLGYEPARDHEEARLRTWRLLNIIRMTDIPYEDLCIEDIIPNSILQGEGTWNVVCPLLCFSIVEWHQVDCVVRQFSVDKHIPTTLLNINVMHGHDGHWGRGEWYLEFLQGWCDMWHSRSEHRSQLHHNFDLQPSKEYLHCVNSA
ncbi:hypothetical protein AHAS_Ahas04G0104300 [Arachis hypogaea]